jgi:translation elongation factor EF-1alpha
MAEQEIGVVTHYFGHLEVAGIKVTDGSLKVGDTIHVLGHTTDFTETVGSIQMEHGAIEEAKPGDEIGVKVVDHAREHDKVYKVL